MLSSSCLFQITETDLALDYMGSPNQQKLKKRFFNSLVQVVVDIQDPQEATRFLKEIIPEEALETAIKRLGIAYLLQKGLTYREIGKQLSLSSATIAEISKKIDQDSGIKIALDKMLTDEWAGRWAKKINSFLIGKR